eukprot:TRINITY_DN21441_c0_g1_i3.p1 TRINITY_DN21441_c0_g1~~TRINITY_DN21441_c0_g1_i3.p1  ORF type:complete len:518 (+),score=128.56 TRINITY_DN21441_c0_g1_i3:86-1639(+)
MGRRGKRGAREAAGAASAAPALPHRSWCTGRCGGECVALTLAPVAQPGGAVVVRRINLRTASSLDSDLVRALEPGEAVQVVEVAGGRVRLAGPPEGWASAIAKGLTYIVSAADYEAVRQSPLRRGPRRLSGYESGSEEDPTAESGTGRWLTRRREVSLHSGPRAHGLTFQRILFKMCAPTTAHCSSQYCSRPSAGESPAVLGDGAFDDRGAEDSGSEQHREGEAPQRVRRAELVLRERTARLLLVLERCCNPHNQSAVLRTAEALGVQHVWTVEPPRVKQRGGAPAVGVTAGCERWLTRRSFGTTAQCIAELREKGWAIWATDLSREAVALRDGEDQLQQMPPRVALVFGSETAGVSEEMLLAADRRVYLPMHGFAESLNVGIAAALVTHEVLRLMGPGVRGTLPPEEQRQLRQQWLRLLASNPTARRRIAYYAEHPAAPLRDLRDGRGTLSGGTTRRVIRKVAQKEAAALAEQGAAAAAAEGGSPCSPALSWRDALLLAVGTACGAAAAACLSSRR